MDGKNKQFVKLFNNYCNQFLVIIGY